MIATLWWWYWRWFFVYKWLSSPCTERIIYESLNEFCCLSNRRKCTINSVYGFRDLRSKRVASVKQCGCRQELFLSSSIHCKTVALLFPEHFRTNSLQPPYNFHNFYQQMHTIVVNPQLYCRSIILLRIKWQFCLFSCWICANWNHGIDNKKSLVYICHLKIFETRLLPRFQC
jgi:hypothetical protein